jgi:4-hydroxybenzoate polyprenyltransferase
LKPFQGKSFNNPNVAKKIKLNSFKRFIDFILFGNIYVAVGAFCLVQSSVIQLQFTDHLLSYSLLVFFATLFVYNFQRIFYKSPSENNPGSIRRNWIFNNKTSIKLLSLIGFIGVSITFFFNDHKILLYLSPLLILSLIYFLPFIKLRKNPWLKLLTLVVVWTIVTAVVPILLTGIEHFTKNDLLHILVRFCFMMAICIPFDIRDLEIDKADSVSTLPLMLSENIARWLAFGFMLLYIFLIIPEYHLEMINIKVFLALLLSAIINAIVVLMSNSKRSEYFYVAGIDGTMILQGVLVMGVYYL